ncbi:hypothetical protein EJB05_30002, partial [Eragrostis curvula]
MSGPGAATVRGLLLGGAPLSPLTVKLLHGRLLRLDLHHTDLPQLLVRALSSSGLHLHALRLHSLLPNPSHLTFPFALKSASRLPHHHTLSAGVQLHARSLKLPSHSNPHVLTSLLNLYAKCGGHLHEAQRVFDEMPQPSTVSWTALITAYMDAGRVQEAVGVARNAFARGMRPDSFTAVRVLTACARVADLVTGEAVWNAAQQEGLAGSVFVATAAMDLYIKCGGMERAREVFDHKMPNKDAVAWGTMVTGYASNGLPQEALDLFFTMQAKRMKPDCYTVAGVLSACTRLGALELGRQAVGMLQWDEFLDNPVLGTALIDMYAKCGCMGEAWELFQQMRKRDIIVWNAMILGLGMTGHEKIAFALVGQMNKLGITLNDNTFIGLLCSCTHTGLVQDGRRYFYNMTHVYRVSPRIEHYGCMVDLLSRVGQLDEAHQLIQDMPMQANAVVWGALLGGCKIHRDAELAEHVLKQLIRLEPWNSGNYVMLSNIYSNSGRWEDAAKLRLDMKKKGVEKVLACSWVEFNGKVHEFRVGDKSHSLSDQIYAKLDELGMEMKAMGYKPTTEVVMFDIEDEEKESTLVHHSEKIAIAFSLLTAGPGETIRVTKNLRVCSDCHTAIKLISRITHRMLPSGVGFCDFASLWQENSTRILTTVYLWLYIPRFKLHKALRIRFCNQSLLRGSLDPSLVDQIPGRQNDRKTHLGELNWIFTAITDTIAWNVLPHDLFQRLFRQDLLVASLFRNLLRESCIPQIAPQFPTICYHQHTSTICEFQPSPFFTEQLTAFEVWLDHGSEDKKHPEQLPIVPQVLLSQSHRFRALVLLGRFLDMGPWAVDLALSVGIFPYVLKLLQTSAIELRQILVFIWTKILSLDKWLCLCLGKLWEDFPVAQLLGLQSNAPDIVTLLLSEPQPEVRASAVSALGNLLDIGSSSLSGVDDDPDDDEKVRAEISVVRSLLQVASDGSPLVRSEVATALTRFALGHNKHLKSVAAEYWRPQASSLLKSLPSLANINNPTNVYSSTSILQGSSGLASHIGPVLRVGSDSSGTGRDGRISTSSPMATSSILHGSPQSDDSSQHSDSGILLRENVTNGGLSHNRSMPADSAIYSQFISTMCSVAKDPYPRIATIGRRALSLIGVEQVVMKHKRINSGGTHQGETSAPPSNFGMAHSSSWFDMNSGSFSMAFRTPPVSPPQHDYLTGLRRVCSMEFRPHLMNSPEGLADPLLSSVAAPSNADLSIAPQSIIYNWSCGHFARPLLTGSDDNEEANARREERERTALDCISKCQHSCTCTYTLLCTTHSSCKMTSQIASWDTRFELGTKAALLMPFSPIVVAADENEQIRVWNYDDALPVSAFENHKLSDRGLSKLLLINELDESLLLAASSDGNVRVWKNFTQKGGQKLVTAFSSVQGQRAAGRSVVFDWQQQSGYLYASGDMASILVWDLDKEQLLSTIQSSANSAISALSASQVRSGQFAAGFADASVRIFDVRAPDRIVYTARPHAPRTEKVVGIGFQPGFDPRKIVSASQAGDIRFLDIRRAAEPYLTIEAHRGSLTALAVHRHAPVVASGSAKQMIKVFSLEGEQLTIIRYQSSFMGQRIGSVNCLSFRPYKSLLAAGAGDNALVSIYAEENYK